MPPAEPLPDRRAALRAPPAKPPRRQTPAPVDYPESDGKPMAETPIHWHATVDFARPLMDRYAVRPDAYVGSDMLWYWEEGNKAKRVSPDVFVAFGPSKAPERRVWKVWEEGVAADFVLEVTSQGAREAGTRGSRRACTSGWGSRSTGSSTPRRTTCIPTSRAAASMRKAPTSQSPLSGGGANCRASRRFLALSFARRATRCACSTRCLASSCPAPGSRPGSLGRQTQTIEEQSQTIEEQVQTIGAAKARIAELERRLAEAGD